MDTTERAPTRRWTRRRLLATGGVAAAAGTAAAAVDRTSIASQLKGKDAEILNMFLLLERVQLAFYRAVLERSQLSGDLLAYASTVVRQEGDHVASLSRRLGARADAPPRTAFDDRFATPHGFPDAAIAMEEAVLSAYIGQGANLSRRTVADVAVLVSVEARQAAWIRDIAGISPAPRAADPARKASDVLDELRQKGVLR